MSEINKSHRWYDQDKILSKCVSLLYSLPDPLKRQTSTFLMNEIIDKQPYINMINEEIYTIVTSEGNKNRWYDHDEVTRIFMELLKNASDDSKKEISLKAITYMEDLISNQVNEVANQ